MKRHWFLLMLIVVSIAIILAISPVTRWAYKTFYLDPALAGTPERAIKWADPYTYEETWYSTSRPIIVCIALSILWGPTLVRTRKKPGKAALGIILLVFLLLWTNIPLVHASTVNINYVDVLAIGDEIFMSNPDWIKQA